MESSIEAHTQPALLDKCPTDRIVLRFLLINGLKYDLVVDPFDKIDAVRDQALATWPGGSSLNFWLISRMDIH
jgi:hypothetical protein